ncbi:zinc finger protein 224 [Culex quinquefasciatus]|uniref:Zinc finger protein 224 n=1 Tax=Culex quinquefasciatus TaxID=7176 RepID=B0XCL4_CULQU|nr:zinc finger protein 224 [Culex quinquefasciatus]|eukprot:XP_001867386.1 zinc finger protein 224 [Culex quinquefasciatus]
MSAKIFNQICRICTDASGDEMHPLYESFGDGKTPAHFIEECFGITINILDGMPSNYCGSCKGDLQAALRFHGRLVDSEVKLKDMFAVPKIEVTEPVDGSISSVFISEVYIKSEAEELEPGEVSNYGGNSSEEEFQPRPKRKTRLSKRKAAKTEQPPMVSVKAEIHDDSVDRKATEDVADVKPDTSKPPKKRWTMESDVDSSDDSLSDYADSARSSDSDDDDENGHSSKKKRLYYGVKADSQPKRCCECKDLLLDSYEKVQEHSDKYHLRYRVTNPREIDDNPFECPHCYRRFECKKEFLRHQRKMYVEMLHPCPKCNEEFANHYVMQKHLKTYHKKKLIIERMEELRQESHICCACKQKFESKEALKAHADDVHLKESQAYDGDLEIECDVCYRRFKTRQSMKVHQYRMFRGKKFICSLCGKAFKEKSFLRDHENSHRREKPYECPKCDARFSIKGSFDAHVRLHDAKEEFKCEYCGRGFRTKSLLKGHLTVHSEDRPFKCHLCPITFTQQRLLDSHIEFHLGNKPFKCQQCPASYRYQRDLRGHIREKHEGILSFQCTQCPKAFNRKKPLLVHLKTHEAM